MASGIRPYRVLVVDDDTDQATLVEIVFAHLDANARLSVAWSAEDAIAHLEGNQRLGTESPKKLPDVIVLDINMPGMGGIGFLEWYSTREDLQHIPVVVFTSDGDPGLVERCLSLGAWEFKQKPSNFAELVPIVQRVLDRWHPFGKAELA